MSSPESFKPDTDNETLAEITELLTMTELAASIIDDAYEESRNEGAYVRVNWEHHDAFEQRVYECRLIELEKKRYQLEINELGESASDTYFIEGDGVTDFDSEEGAVSYGESTPNEERRYRDARKFLRDKYRRTDLGLSSEEYSATVFDTITGYDTVETIMNLPDNHFERLRVDTLLVHARSSDAVLGGRAVRQLYEIASRNKMIYSAADAFIQAFYMSQQASGNSHPSVGSLPLPRINMHHELPNPKTDDQ